MEKRTLLQIINDVAVSMDYETVNDISDTPEAERIARIARNEYSKLMSIDEWPHLKVVAPLEGLSDVTQPNFMRVPALVAQIDSIRYTSTETGDTDESIGNVEYIENFNEFLDKIYQRNTSDDAIEIFETDDGIPIWTYTDRAPTFCTSFDDDIIIFDAYNADEDSTLQSSKSLCIGLRAVAWEDDKDFIPALPINMFAMYISKVKVVANEQLRQVALTTEANDYQFHFNRLSRKKRVNQPTNTRPNYGRGRK
jgi:hypothetical protein